ncbi:MAG: hypothetical protein M0C28_41115 [Candidatus Moduliflexus flocculans]|nr:hypothetical protein [Candidatus Moduliflexus flocculans]
MLGGDDLTPIFPMNRLYLALDALRFTDDTAAGVPAAEDAWGRVADLAWDQFLEVEQDPGSGRWRPQPARPGTQCSTCWCSCAIAAPRCAPRLARRADGGARGRRAHAGHRPGAAAGARGLGARLRPPQPAGPPGRPDPRAARARRPVQAARAPPAGRLGAAAPAGGPGDRARGPRPGPAPRSPRAASGWCPARVAPAWCDVDEALAEDDNHQRLPNLRYLSEALALVHDLLVLTVPAADGGAARAVTVELPGERAQAAPGAARPRRPGRLRARRRPGRRARAGRAQRAPPGARPGRQAAVGADYAEALGQVIDYLFDETRGVEKFCAAARAPRRHVGHTGFVGPSSY